MESSIDRLDATFATTFYFRRSRARVRANTRNGFSRHMWQIEEKERATTDDFLGILIERNRRNLVETASKPRLKVSKKGVNPGAPKRQAPSR